EQPVLHYWRTHPEAQALAPASVVELQVAVGRALGPAIEALVANHLNTNAPVVIEGDYLLPAFAALPSFGAEPSAGRVRAVFLLESDERQLLANFTKREPGAPAQTGRATVSRIYGEWLAREATDRGLAVVAARPWNTVLERVRLTAANSGMDPRT
ncbi:MAG: hypothetical protein ACRDGQ_02615, partial [Candidatus Limnocylindrales bacterium]